MEYYGDNDYRDYLAHHGVLGMKWGIRRYQPYGIGYQREGGKGGKFLGKLKNAGAAIKKKVKTYKLNKKRKAALEKARAAKEAKAKHDAEIARILKSGTAAELYEHRNEYDKKQIDEAIQRINTEQRLRDLKTDEMLRKADTAKKFVDRAVGYANTALNVYDVATKIMDKKDQYQKNKKDLANEAKFREAIRSGDPAKIREISRFLSDKQLEAALKRQKNYNQLTDFINKEESRAERKEKKKNGDGADQNQQQSQQKQQSAKKNDSNEPSTKNEANSTSKSESSKPESSSNESTKSENSSTRSSYYDDFRKAAEQTAKDLGLNSDSARNATTQILQRYNDMHIKPSTPEKRKYVMDVVEQATRNADHFTTRKDGKGYENGKKTPAPSFAEQFEAKIRADVQAGAAADKQRSETRAKQAANRVEADRIRKVAEVYQNKSVDQLISEGKGSQDKAVQEWLNKKWLK